MSIVSLFEKMKTERKTGILFLSLLFYTNEQVSKSFHVSYCLCLIETKEMSVSEKKTTPMAILSLASVWNACLTLEGFVTLIRVFRMIETCLAFFDMPLHRNPSVFWHRQNILKKERGTFLTWAKLSATSMKK